MRSLEDRSVDEGLIQALRNLLDGDKSSFEPVIVRSRLRLYRFCLYLCKNESAAEELCQETYLKAMKSLEQLRDPNRIYPWLFQIARHLFLDGKRSPEGRREALTKSASPDQNEAESELARLPDPTASAADAVAGLKLALSRVPEDQRAALILVDHEGYSYAEAAEIEGVSAAALKARLERGRKALYEIFHGKEESS